MIKTNTAVLPFSHSQTKEREKINLTLCLEVLNHCYMKSLQTLCRWSTIAKRPVHLVSCGKLIISYTVTGCICFILIPLMMMLQEIKLKKKKNM